MNDNLILNRRRFLREAGRVATGLAASAAVAPAILCAGTAGKTIGVGCHR
jgi:hypothetical protein